LFDLEEIMEWEQQIQNRRLKDQIRFKRAYDPRIKKLNEFRNHRVTKHFYNREVKYIKKLTQRRFRRKFKSRIYNEEYYKPVPHDYRTYGWLSF